MLATEKIIKRYIDYVENIKNIAGLTTNNIIGELAENYVIEKLGLTRADTNQKNWDANKGKIKYQIKYRTPSKNGIIRISFKNIDNNCWNVDRVAIVLPSLEIFIINKKHIETTSQKKKNTLVYRISLKDLEGKH